MLRRCCRRERSISKLAEHKLIDEDRPEAAWCDGGRSASYRLYAQRVSKSSGRWSERRTPDVEEVSSSNDSVGDVRREDRVRELEERSGEESKEERRHD